ncbi:MAG: diacylglycerol kinase family protein [Anaerolineales bacterium]
MSPVGRSPSRIASLRHALRGFRVVLRAQRNAWIHAAASAVVISLAIWLRLEARDWAALLLAVGLVWMAELLNTALEAVVDLASPDAHPLARAGKDVGAAAVLIAAVTSAAVGVAILGPPLWEIFQLSRLFAGAEP